MKTINVHARYNYGWDVSVRALCFYVQLATPKGATIGPFDFFLILVNFKTNRNMNFLKLMQWSILDLSKKEKKVQELTLAERHRVFLLGRSKTNKLRLWVRAKFQVKSKKREAMIKTHVTSCRTKLLSWVEVPCLWAAYCSYSFRCSSLSRI